MKIKIEYIYSVRLLYVFLPDISQHIMYKNCDCKKLKKSKLQLHENVSQGYKC